MQYRTDDFAEREEKRMEQNIMYESIQSVTKGTSISGIIVINAMLFVLIFLFLGAVYSGIRKILKKNYILKGTAPKIIGTLILYLVFAALEFSALL
jgi:mannose/fructose/N-acetylgalactosamine-specific phosphotransferase system component IID